MSLVKLSKVFMNDTLDGRNPKQPPWMYKNMLKDGIFTISSISSIRRRSQEERIVLRGLWLAKSTSIRSLIFCGPLLPNKNRLLKQFVWSLFLKPTWRKGQKIATLGAGHVVNHDHWEKRLANVFFYG